MAQQQGNPDPASVAKGMIAIPTYQPVPGKHPLAVDVGDKHVLLPLDGDYNDDKAIQASIDTYKKTGEHWGIFDNLDDAVAYGQAIANWQPPAEAPPAPSTGPMGKVPGVIESVGSGIADLVGGLYEGQPVHPHQIGAQATQAAGPAGLAVYDAAHGQHSDPTSGVQALTKGMLEAQGDLPRQAQDAYGRGEYITGLRKSIDYLLPVIGPAIDAQLDKAVTALQKGRIMRGIGLSIGAAVNALPLGKAAEMRVEPVQALGRTQPTPSLPPEQPPLNVAGVNVPRPPTLMPEQDAPFQTKFGVQTTQQRPGVVPQQGVQIVPPNRALPESAPTAAQAAALAPRPTSQETNEVGAFADREGVNIDLATRTGNDALRGWRDINAKTGIWSNFIDRKLSQRYVEQMHAVGQKLLNLVRPGDAISAIGGGKEAIDVLERLRDKYRAEQNAAYDQARAIAADAEKGIEHPAGATWLQMPVDIRSSLAAMKTLRDRLARDWFVGKEGVVLTQKQARAVAALDTMLGAPGVVPAIELDGWLSNLKAAASADGAGPISSIVKELEGQLQQMLHGADIDDLLRQRAAVEPEVAKAEAAHQAALDDCIQCRHEALNSGTMEYARGEGNIWSQWVERNPKVMAQEKVIAGLKATVDSWTKKAFDLDQEIARHSKVPKATLDSFAKALDEGRAATKKKYAVIDILDRLAGAKKTQTRQVLRDPNRLVKRLTAMRDANIQDLQTLQRVAPEALPPIARGVLQQMLDTGFNESGQLNHGAALYASWLKMGPETKKLLYGPERTQDLTAFFRTAARMSDKANPSGSGYVVTLVGKGVETAGFAFAHPLAGLIWLPFVEWLQAGIARLMWMPGGAKILTRGMETARGSSANAMGAAAEVANALKAVGIAAQSEQARPQQTPTLPAAAQQQPDGQRVGPFTVRASP